MQLKKTLLAVGAIAAAAAAAGAAYLVRMRRSIPGAAEALTAIEAAYASTCAAFSQSGDDLSAFDARDSKAGADADALRPAVEKALPALAPPIAAAFEQLIDNITGAQVQLMAFAMNRQNHGLPNAAQSRAENADLTEFVRLNQPLLDKIRTTLA